MKRLKSMPDKLFHEFVVTAIRDMEWQNIDEYSYAIDYYPYRFTKDQLNYLIDLIDNPEWYSNPYQGRDSKKDKRYILAQYIFLMHSILSVNGEMYLTIDRLIKVLNKYRKNFSKYNQERVVESLPYQRDGLFEEISSYDPTIIFTMLYSKKIISDKKARAKAEKYIDKHIDFFLAYLVAPRKHRKNLKEYFILDTGLQMFFPFSKEFLQKHYDKFSVVSLYQNKYVKADMELQKIMFKEILENTFNTAAEILTNDRAEKFAVTDDQVLECIIKYNL